MPWLVGTLAWLVLAGGCRGGVVDQFAQCTLVVELGATAAAPGDTVIALGEPYTSDFDTTVLVGGARAEIGEVSGLAECSECDRCRARNGCSACGRCLACDAHRDRDGVLREGACTSCVQSVAFVVPELPPGPTSVTVVNAYGTSEGVPLTITAGTASTDTAPAPTDTGSAGGTDTGAATDTSGPARTTETAETADTAADPAP